MKEIFNLFFFHSFTVCQAIFLRNLALHPTWIAKGNDALRNIFGYDASSTDDRILSDRYPRTDDTISSDPHIFTNGNGFGRIHSFFSCAGNTPCPAHAMLTFGPIKTPFPIRTCDVSNITQL